MNRSRVKHKPFDYAHSTALVTGASRGIGEAIARELARREIAALVLTARTRGDLTDLADDLRRQHPRLRVETLVADLAEADAPSRLKAETDRLGVAIDLLVNNAGFGLYGLFAEADESKNAAMIEVNIAALTALTRLYLPAMRQKQRGGIINLASTAAFQPVPFMALYGATKAFVLSFSEALWAEAQEWGPDSDIRIVCLCPGNTATNFGDGMVRGRWESSPQDTPESVAVAGLEALDTNASYRVVGGANYAIALGSRLVPRALMARRTAALLRPVAANNTNKNETPSSKSRLLLVAASVLALVGVVFAFRKNKA